MKKGNKTKIILGGLIGLIILGIIIYKFIMLQKYKTDNIVIDNKAIFNETINVNYQENSNVKFEDMSYYDYFTDYVEKENTDFKVKYDNNNEISSFYSITKKNQFIDLLNINSFVMSSSEDDNNDTDYFTEEDMKDFLNDNKIQDDIGLFNFIKDNYYLNNNMFTSLKRMKSNYIINTFVQVALPGFNSISLINGDKIKGYIINIKSTASVKEIHLLNNHNQYIITLSGDEVTNPEFINNLLSSIKFD